MPGERSGMRRFWLGWLSGAAAIVGLLAGVVLPAARATGELGAPALGTETIYAYDWEDDSFQDGYEGWQLGDSDTAGGTHYWDEDTDPGARAHGGSRAMHCADFVEGAQSGTPQSYYDDMQAFAMRAIDLSVWNTVDTLQASFYVWYDTEADHDWVEFWVSDANAAPGSWQRLKRLSGSSGGWVKHTFDMAQYAGKPDVWIAFKFDSDGMGPGGEGAYIDDLLITGRRVLAPPVLSAPAQDGVLCDLTPAFTWQAVTDAVSYEIEIDDDADFASTEFSAAAASTHFSVPTPLAAGIYNWRVRGVDERGGGPWSSVRRFATSGSEPEAPALSSPADGSQLCAAPYALRWSTMAGATYCRIQVDDDPAFRSPEFDASGASYCSGKTNVKTSLAPGTYSWRVLAANACGEGPWSGSRAFETRAILDPPVLLKPEQGSASGDPTPTFQWAPLAAADTYRVRVGQEPDLASPAVDVSSSEQAHTLVQALEPGDYHWDVRGVNECGEGPVSSPAWPFTIEVDSERPARIDNLAAWGGTVPGTVDLAWTAPGDNGREGTASGYRVRYNLVPITEDNWDRCAEVSGEPLPRAAGSSQAMTVKGLIPDQTYFFAIQSWDEVPNDSEISNNAAARATMGGGWNRLYLPLTTR